MPSSSLAEGVLVLPERLVGVLVALARLQVALPVNGTTEENNSEREENFGSCMNYLGIATCGAKNRHAPFPSLGKASIDREQTHITSRLGFGIKCWCNIWNDPLGLSSDRCFRKTYREKGNFFEMP